MGKFLFCIDLGGTYIKTHIFTIQGESIGNIEKKLENKSPSSVVESIFSTIEDSIKSLTPNSTISDYNGIGIGIPGTVDSNTGLIHFAPNLGWKNIDFCSLFSKYTNLPVKIGNDANLAAIGEKWMGGATGCDNFITITIGTGIGGGIFVNGKLLSGASNNGGEIGHMTINVGGLKCNCGNSGCWERYGSTSALIDRVKGKLKKKLSSNRNYQSPLLKLIGSNISELEGKQIVKAAKSGDNDSIVELETMQYYLAVGIGNLISIFNPELILLTGGITAQGEWFLSPIKRFISEIMPQISLKNLRIEIGKLGNMAGAYGAAYIGGGFFDR